MWPFNVCWWRQNSPCHEPHFSKILYDQASDLSIQISCLAMINHSLWTWHGGGYLGYQDGKQSECIHHGGPAKLLAVNWAVIRDRWENMVKPMLTRTFNDQDYLLWHHRVYSALLRLVWQHPFGKESWSDNVPNWRLSIRTTWEEQEWHPGESSNTPSWNITIRGSI